MLDLRPHLAPLIGRGDGQTTQLALERLSGVAQAHISGWLTGKRILPIERQIQLADALGLDVDIAVTVTPKSPSPQGHRRTRAPTAHSPLPTPAPPLTTGP